VELLGKDNHRITESALLAMEAGDVQRLGKRTEALAGQGRAGVQGCRAGQPHPAAAERHAPPAGVRRALCGCRGAGGSGCGRPGAAHAPVEARRPPPFRVAAAGELMCEAQCAFDERAAPLCPEQLSSPVLHLLLAHPALQAHIHGGKGVGSQVRESGTCLRAPAACLRCRSLGPLRCARPPACSACSPPPSSRAGPATAGRRATARRSSCAAAPRARPRPPAS
jgi:hypothetical protein